MSAARPASLGTHAPVRPSAVRRPHRARARARRAEGRPEAAGPGHEALRSGPGWLLFSVTALCLVGALVLAIVSLQAVLAQGSFRTGELSRRAAELRTANERLELEVASLSAPGRIAREARRLGLVLPDPDSVRVLTVDEREGRRRP